MFLAQAFKDRRLKTSKTATMEGKVPSQRPKITLWDSQKYRGAVFVREFNINQRKPAQREEQNTNAGCWVGLCACVNTQLLGKSNFGHPCLSQGKQWHSSVWLGEEKEKREEGEEKGR